VVVRGFSDGRGLEHGQQRRRRLEGIRVARRLNGTDLHPERDATGNDDRELPED
jgi:hypothetical protein